MKFMFLLYGDERQGETPGEMPVERAEAWGAFNAEAEAAGVLVAWDGLVPTSEARTVRVEGGQAVATDGPFAETKEQLGGFMVLDCVDRDDAERWAARMPCAPHGSIEVRAVLARG